MILKLTEHAKFKMYEEGITEEMIREAIQRGSKFKQTEDYLAVYTFYSVAYKILAPEVYKIKTVFINR